MSLTEKSRRPGWETEAATNEASTTSSPKRSLSPIPLIVVLCIQSVVMVGFAIADAIEALR